MRVCVRACGRVRVCVRGRARARVHACGVCVCSGAGAGEDGGAGHELAPEQQQVREAPLERRLPLPRPQQLLVVELVLKRLALRSRRPRKSAPHFRLLLVFEPFLRVSYPPLSWGWFSNAWPGVSPQRGAGGRQRRHGQSRRRPALPAADAHSERLLRRAGSQRACAAP